MKKLALVLSSLVIGLGTSRPVYAQGLILHPEVLAATIIKSPELLPQILTDDNVLVSETVNQDLVILGREIEIGSTINGNLLVLGSEVKINQNAHVTGYMIILGGQVTIDGQIDGEVRVVSGELVVGETGLLGSNLIADTKTVSISGLAEIAGARKINEMGVGDKPALNLNQEIAKARDQVLRFFRFFGVILFFGQLILMLLLVRIFGKQLNKLTTIVTKSFWSIMGLGLVKLVVTPVLIALLIASLIGIPIAVALIVVYGVSLFLAEYIAGGVLGHWMAQKGYLATDNLYWQAAAGFGLLQVIAFIPGLGGLVNFLGFLAGMGVVVRLEMGIFKKKS